MEFESLWKIGGTLIAALGYVVGQWRWTVTQSEKLRTDMTALLDAKVAERNHKLDTARAESLAKIERCNAEIAAVNRDLAGLRYEMAKNYAEKKDMDAALERHADSLQLQITRVETMVDKLLGQLGRGLKP